LPTNGLIVDVRGNGGGNIWAGELLLQTLTTRRIEPERFHFINSPSTLEVCRQDTRLSPWVESIDLAIQTGETYSQGFYLTPPESANSLTYHYPGKVVVVIDALCYSTTDIFAAGFQDHKIGKILGTSGRTGAGGANVWTYDLFSNLLNFPSLPKGVQFRTAIRRSTRVGEKAGVPLEDLGVRPDRIHKKTRRDILNDNVDMIAAAAQMLVNS
jgi:C-terminal processing protease CtpA/Prc